MRDPQRELEHLRKLATADPSKRFGKLLKIVRDEAFLLKAWERVRTNKGSRTPGIDGQTRSDVNAESVQLLALELAEGSYEPKPVRRVYIPKGKNGAQRRALGIPALRDRIVQAAVAQVLEAIYEPLFRSCSYGFRPGRSCIDALRHVARAYRAGATWTIEGDLVACFDSLPHGVILGCLRKRIKDERFIDLIRRLLQAGVMEEFRYRKTYSGVPQGGLVSPILSNVVLHEFDCFMERQANPPPLSSKQQQARRNPEYARHKRNLNRWRAQLDGRIPMGRQTVEGLQRKIGQAVAARKQIPCYLPRRVIYYCRYADDYVVVLCQHSKAEAETLKQAMAQWLKEHLGLVQHPEKTRITHWRRPFCFLGYQLRGQRNPNGTRWLRLLIPPEAERDLKQRLKRLCGYTQIPTTDLFVSLNALMRGWSQYYRYAHNAPRRFGYLTGVVFWLVAHYLGRKHRSSIRKLVRRHYGVDPRTGRRALYIERSEGERLFIWNKPPSWCSVLARAVHVQDLRPVTMTAWAGGHSYEQRLELLRQHGERCQQCGRGDVPLVVHHVQRLGRCRQRKRGPSNVIASAHGQQPKLLCRACHRAHHPRGWHDGRA